MRVLEAEATGLVSHGSRTRLQRGQSVLWDSQDPTSAHRVLGISKGLEADLNSWNAWCACTREDGGNTLSSGTFTEAASNFGESQTH